jgi:hypothetical protein
MRILAVLGDDTFAYRFVFLLHLLAVILGFGSSFVYPFLGREARARRGEQAHALIDSSLKASNTLTTPPIYIAGATGILLVIMSDAIDFDEAWVSIAFVLFFLSAGLGGFLHVPNLRRMSQLARELSAAGPPPDAAGAAASAGPGGSTGAGTSPGGPPPQLAELQARGKRAGMYGGILHLSFLALMIDMIWKPGSPFT